jgi:phosphopantetheinyl transferase (holo-ACP synthase)
MKALGTGHSRGVLWRGIEVVRAAGGPPQLNFTAALPLDSRNLARNTRFWTITHSETLAIAQVMLLL